MRVAAVQMRAELGNVETNLKSAERLASQAFEQVVQKIVGHKKLETTMGYIHVFNEDLHREMEKTG